jgi:adenylosuccinate lyase
MKLSILTAISPVDGRYRDKTVALSDYFSEFALFKYRILVEIEYFISLCELPVPQLAAVNKPAIFDELRNIYQSFSEEDALRIKEIEKTTNHDIKAVEYFLKEYFKKLHIEKYSEFIHFGLTSQDINNTAFPLSIKNALESVFFTYINNILEKLRQFTIDWKNVPMLAKTHGQPASPTRLGKEIQVFVSRLEQQIRLLKEIPVSAKFGGATGNYNAHHVAYPSIDWKSFGDNFVKKLGLVREEYTTQISNYDNLSALFDGLKRINTILIDLSQDFWLYF